MALKTLPYGSLRPLVRKYLKRKEEPAATGLIRALWPARERGYLTRSELEQVCHWKSPRALPLIQSNTVYIVRSATKRALATKSERERLAALRELRGVSVPMASAILMLLYPKRYGVIDIRVWQLLYKIGTVTKNPKGIGFSFSNWYQFLMIIRYFASEFGVTARDVERALFVAHKAYQDGTLY
jgi:hypothetical protein